ncbi:MULTISPECIES: aspartate/glutamate racemase family protein [unclassified Nocardioides]|uniref:aspartate/glutamate racemase family protein n=1 Tax=unclassified Nocardioides TaxID=2615069 RepID=UPI0009F12EB3|nr:MULTISPECIES: aspartate/glutamate racemase family protein [unclassified Nocardioides]GAW50404.1 aspartate racemase [Nocardioides sp. PD653-B2]GAW55831.1 aspartate racemase [Nocardioides sp. PD653]
MRRIGLLGGMSWESSALFYELLNELTKERLGGLHSARVLMSSVDFAEIAELQHTGDWARAGEVLADEARRLEAAGAELLVLCTNTMHKVADDITAAVSIPFLHLGDATGRAVVEAGLARVALLGTRFTMEQDFYVDRIASYGVEVIVPEPDQRELVHRIIYDELVLGVVSDVSRTAYEQVIAALVDRGAQGVILGCTEIELLVGADNSPVPVFPTTLIHAQAALAAALAP